MKRHLRLRARGAAAVETAVTMIVLVPLIFYTLFLEDMLAYKLENQEPGIVAAWDYTTNDYMKGKLKDVGRLNRLKYCDHTAAFDSFDAPYDCQGAGVGSSGGEDSGGGSGDGSVDVEGGGGASDKGHHQAGAAHQCWIVPGADQVRCFMDKQGGLAMTSSTVPAATYLQSGWNKGGVIDCRARLAVMNYMLPNKVWGLMGMTAPGGGPGKGAVSGGKGRNRDDKLFTEIDQATNDKYVHADKDHAENAWIFREEHLYVLHDSWALNDIDKVDPETGVPATNAVKPGMIPGTDTYHPLLDRSGHYYNYYASDANQKAKDYFDEVKDDFLKDNVANFDLGMFGGDNPETLPVFWDKPDNREGNPEGFASGWADSRQSTASNGRQNYPWD